MHRLCGSAVLLAALATSSYAEPSGDARVSRKCTVPSDASAKSAAICIELRDTYDRLLAEVTQRRNETRKEFDEILTAYKTGQRSGADVMRAQETWIVNEAAYHTVVAFRVVCSEVKYQDILEYAKSCTARGAEPGLSACALEVEKGSTPSNIPREETSGGVGQAQLESSIREHAEKYGISIGEAKRQIEYYNAHQGQRQEK